MNDLLQVKPQLAESWSVSSDGLTYTFHLRPNLKFADGVPLTSADVAYSLDRALSPATAKVNSAARVHLGLLKDADQRLNGQIPTLIGDSIVTPDASTIVLTLSQSAAYFLTALAYPVAFVVEKERVEQGDTNWASTTKWLYSFGGDGPFKVWQIIGNNISFEPNPNYYGPKPNMQVLKLVFFKTPEQAYAAYQANQIDKTPIPPAEMLQARLRTTEFHSYPELAIDYVAMNYLYKPFDNVHIRQAFGLALDKNLLANTIYPGSSFPTCHIVPLDTPGYDTSLTCPDGSPPQGDPVQAKTLFEQGLQEEGLTLATFPHISIAYDASLPNANEIILTMREMWLHMFGIEIGAQALSPSALQQAETHTRCTSNDPAQCLNQGLAMWYTSKQADYPDPQDVLTLQFDKGSPFNTENYGLNFSADAATQAAVQQLLEQADVNQNLPARMAQYNQAEQQLVNDVAWLPIFQQVDSYLLRPPVTGVVNNALGWVPPDDWANYYDGPRPAGWSE